MNQVRHAMRLSEPLTATSFACFSAHALSSLLSDAPYHATRPAKRDTRKLAQ